MENRCNHSWRSLYQKPLDSGFLNVFQSRKLGTFKLCQFCRAVGQINETGRIVMLPRRRWLTQRSQALQWRNNLLTFAVAVNTTETEDANEQD